MMRERVGGVDLYYRDTGEGEPVVFLHGYPLSGRLWDETVSELGDGFRCIVPDLRGHGASEASERADMARYADDVAELLDALGETRPVVLVGLSMGGYVAFEFIRRHGDRVRALVLVDTRAGPDTLAAAEARRETAERVLQEGSGAVADEMAERLFASGAPRTLRSRWREIMAATPAGGVAAALRAMADRPDSLPTLEALRIPVLVVVGEEDAITPPAEAERMASAAAGAGLEVVAGAGHMTPVERPAEFGAILRHFLARL
jgi:pimeloyl-ACP methyl ester carboxylesterase